MNSSNSNTLEVPYQKRQRTINRIPELKTRHKFNVVKKELEGIF